MNADNVKKIDKQIMAKMDQKEISSYFNNKLLSFGTAGIRATMGPGTQQMNVFVYQQIAEGYAKYIKQTYPLNPYVVIGHDNRKNSQLFATTCANVLSSFGVGVYLFKNNHLIPTPIISYTIRKMNAMGGIIITASHNAKEYNGFKAYNPDGGQILPAVANKIVSLMPKYDTILTNKYKANFQLINYLSDDIIDQYFADVQSVLVNRQIIYDKKPFKVVFTGHHGTSCKLLPELLKKLNFNVYPLHNQCFYSEKFINSPSPNPENPDSFEQAIKYAKHIHSSIIFGVDPDADRMAVMINHHNK